MFGDFMKTVLVTGSAKGLGKALILEFANKGYNTIITYNNSINDALILKEEVLKHNVYCEVLKLDLRDEQNIKDIFNKKIDIIVNNAVINHDDEILNKTKDDFMEVLEVNLVGTFLMCKEAIKSGVKDIINISSTDSIDTYNSLNIDYSSSKAGLNIVTKTIASTFPEVRVIGILPVFIDTESVLEMDPVYLENELKRTKQNKLLKKEEVAKKIYNIYNDNNIESGSLIRIEE